MDSNSFNPRRWWQVPLLFLACLLAGSSPTRAISVLNSDYTHLVSVPANANGTYKGCYVDMVMLYYDWTTNANSFWVSAPEIYVDGVKVCNAEEIGQYYGNGSGNGTQAKNDAYNHSLWWGKTYDKTVDGITYRVRFHEPFESQTATNKRKFSTYMRVYISSMESGSKHEIRIKGKWVYNRDQQIDINGSWNFVAPTMWSDDANLVADMTDYQHLTLSGNLNYSYGATTVGLNPGGEGKVPTVSSPYRSHNYVAKESLVSSHEYPYHTSSFSGQVCNYTREDKNHKDGSIAAVEYVIPVEDNGFVTNFYKWYEVGVPGFALPKSLSATGDKWNKKMEISWDVDRDWEVVNNNRRCKEGKWVISRDGTPIGSKDYGTDHMSFTDESVPDYNASHTYKVAFVPEGMPNGTNNDYLAATITTSLDRQWAFSEFLATLVDEDTHVKLSWKHSPIQDASGSKTYTLSLYRSADNGATWGTAIYTTPITSNGTVEGTYTDNSSALLSQHTYKYQLRITLLEYEFTSESSPVTLGGSQLKSFTASRGTYSNMVKLTWNVKQVGGNETTFVVARRPLGTEGENKGWSTIYTTSGVSSSYSYDDVTALLGKYNEYRVAIVDKDNPTSILGSLTTDGFTYSTGVFSGRVKYGTGTAVEGVKIKVKPQSGNGDQNALGLRSLKLTGSGAGLICKTDKESVQQLFGGDFSIQMYLNPSLSEMDGSVASYNLLHAIHIFYMSLTKSGNAYKLGAWVGGASEASNLTIPADKWSHVTLVHNHDAKTTYLYVTAEDTLSKALVRNGYQINWTKNGVNDPMQVDSLDIFSVAGLGKLVKNNFRGYVDEFRFFTKALSEKEILLNYNHPLAGNEDGLAIYYPFDEGLAKQTVAYDYSKTNGVANDRHARTYIPAFSESVKLPSEEQLCMMNYTDSLGNYTIRGIPFLGEGTAYSVIPEYNIHEFSPSSQSRFISANSLVHSGVDFEDVSSFPVSGTVYYANSNYPVEGVNLYVDGQICSKDGEPIVTDANGHFEISVPIGKHFIKIAKQGHVFMNDGRFPEDPNDTGERYTFNEKIPDMVFYDQTLVNFTGRVVGGDIEGNKSVGFGLSTNNVGETKLELTPVTSKTIYLNALKDGAGYIANSETLPVASATESIGSNAYRGTGTNADKIYIHTDPQTGEFSAMIPPLQYSITAMKLVKTDDPLITDNIALDLTNPSMELNDTLYAEDGTAETLYKYNTKLKHIIHNAPTFTVKQQGRTDGLFGIDQYTIEDAFGKLTLDVIKEENGVKQYAYRDVPLFIKEDPYTFDIEGYEEYTNVDNNITTRVPLAGTVVTINNALSADQSVYVEDGTTTDGQVKAGQLVDLKPNQLQLNDDGKATYKWIAGLPNIADPFTRTITMAYEIGGATKTWDGISGIILGDLPTGNNFLTQGPSKLLMILRDPPGTNSFAEWTSGSSTTTSTVVGNTFTENFETKFQHKFGLTTKTIVGTPGVGNIIVADAKDDLTLGAKVESSGENSTTRSYTTTATQTITTSAAQDYVGDQGDVFVGTSTNIIFGKARNLTLKRQSSGNTAELGVEDIISTGLQFGTMFSYTQNYIENVLFPNFKLMRKKLLRHVDTQAEIDSYVNGTDKVVYLTLLNEDDEDFGKEGTYKAFAPATLKDGEHYEDSVKWVTNEINNWIKYLSYNEQAKVYAFKNRDLCLMGDNLSFDSGTTVTNTLETSNSVTNTWDWTVSAGLVVENSFGFEIQGFGIDCTISDETMGGRHETEENGTESVTSFSYTLAEDGDDDALSVDVYRVDAYGPIFRTRAGQTCCPYEGKVVTKYYEPGTIIMDATMQIEVPHVTVDAPIISDIPSGGEANYTLRLSNASEIDEDVYYRLFVDDESNPDGANLLIDGRPVTDNRVIKIPAGQTVTKQLQLKQTNQSILDYERIAIVLASQCQYDPTSTWDVITDTAFVSAHFVPSSSPVDLALSTTLMNKNTGTNLNLTFSGFDRNYRGLKAFRLQYRKQGEAKWTQLHEYVLDKGLVTNANEQLPAEGAKVTYRLPMASYADGDYLFRVLSVSTYGTEEIFRSSNEIALVKDLQSPAPLGQPEPSDGILDIGEDVSVTFSEPFLKGLLSKDVNFRVTGVLNGLPVSHGTALSMQDTETTAQTEASINLSGKPFSIDAWVNLGGEGTILSHGAGTNKLTVCTDADDKLVVDIAGNTYTSINKVPTGEWAFLSLSMTADGKLNASVASDATTTVLFREQAVVAYEGNGPLAVGKRMTGAMHELLLWDEAHDMTTALMNRSKTKSPSTRHLIGYWKMNEGEGTSIRDYARSRNMTMPDETWYLNNKNKAVSLDGSHYVALYAAELPITSEDDYALEMWMRGDTQTGEAQLLQAGEIGLWLNTEGQLQLTTSSSYDLEGEKSTLTSSQPLTDNAWHHVALNVLHQTAAAVYVDGARVLALNAANMGGMNTDNILVGVRRVDQNAGNSDAPVYAYNRSFKGEIDEVRVWGATMNADLLAANRKVRLTGSEAGLLAYYPFETEKSNAYNQMETVGSADDLTDSGHEAQLVMLSGSPAEIAYTDNAPALREKPAEANVSFSYVASDTKVVITIDEDPAAIDGCTLNFTVRDLQDANGNYSEPAVWSAFVNQKELLWKDDVVSASTAVETSAAITATIVNKGGNQQMWTLSGMPSWLQASTEYGTTNPLEETQVVFTVSPATPIGKYEETIYLKGNNGIETPLTVSVRVTGDEPLWSVTPGNFMESMNLMGNLFILDIPSEDSDDLVGAFIGNQCRGVAKPVYNKRYDRYFVTMDIYGDSDDADEPIEFKVYDASTGIIYPVVMSYLDGEATPSAINFVAESLIGRYSEPVKLAATDEIEQNIDLGQGWNWMSLAVKPNTFTVDNVFAKADGKAEFVKNFTDDAEFDGKHWIYEPGSTIETMNNREMYLVQTSDALTLSVTGHRVNSSDEPITVNNGWSWVAFNTMSVMSLEEALAGMEPLDDEIIKGQRGVAYYDNGAWSGSLQQLSPGLGYKIHGKNARTFIYPTRTSAAGVRNGARLSAQASQTKPQSSSFNVIDFRDYPANMVLIAQVVRDGEPLSGAALGVFAGEECREAAVTDEKGMVYITIPGDEPVELSFRVDLYGTVYSIAGTIGYETDAVIGKPSSPYVINLGTTTGIASFDNPTASPVDNCYDLSGRKIDNSKSASRKLSKGVYIVNGQKKVK